MSERIAIVTGAAGRIGGATARRFAADGIRVVATDLDGDRLAAALGSLVDEGAVVPVVADVTDRAQVDALVDRAVEAFGPPNILVNSAGGSAKLIGKIRSFEETDPEVWEWLLRMNVLGLFACTQSVLRVMPRNSGSRIIHLASIAGMIGLPGRSDYAATKGAVLAFTKSLAMELGATGITVNAVSPGQVPGKKSGTESDGRRNYLRRPGTPEDIANVIAFLAREDASYVTGQNYVVDGGRSLGPMDGALAMIEGYWRET